MFGIRKEGATEMKNERCIEEFEDLYSKIKSGEVENSYFDERAY